MKLQFKKRRLLPAALAIVVLVVGSGVAYAYWTAGGSGSGGAGTAASVSNVTVEQTSTVTSMHPGDTAQTLSGNFDNGNTGPVYIATVTASIASVAKAVGAPDGTCAADDFTLANPIATVNAEIPAGSAQGAWTGPTIKFNDKLTNQDACKGATVTLSYVAA
ncbi:MAG TPA: hypothetical protein VF371_07505 [Candidatus Limnocylindrales bacterium]